MTDKQLKRYVSDFRKGLLEGHPSNAMCFVVTSPLASLLRLEGVDCELIEGEIINNGSIWGHFWIKLADGRILDPTADQFGLVSIYLGPKPESYVEKG